MIPTHSPVRVRRLAWRWGALLAVALALFWRLHGVYAQDLEWRGLIEVWPGAAGAGAWTVAGQQFTATGDTQFDETEGALGIGVCAKVTYVNTEQGKVATEIDSEPAEDCSTGGDGNHDGNQDGDGNHDGEHDGDGAEHVGLIESLPASGLVGEWVVDGVTYTTTPDTEFNQEHGGFAKGVCVQVETVDSTSTVAKEIESEEAYKCTGRQNPDDNTPEGELYGKVTALPDGLIGTWELGTFKVEVDDQTELNANGGVFAVGATVQVHFFTDADGVNHATEIELKYAHEDEHEDGGSGEHEGNEGQAFGKIDSIPDGGLGTWRIGGIDYTVNAETEVDHDPALAVGMLVKVEYTVNADGSRTAHEIKATDDTGGVGEPDHEKLVGFVEKMPASGFLGAWTIAGVEFTADESTKFEEDHGTFAVGAYVEVEYSADTHLIHQIETEVPPGAGDNNTVGEVGSLDDTASAAAVQAATSVRIGGVTYAITPATLVNDTGATLAVGSLAAVNSYQAADGSHVATRIRTITQDHRVLLPLLK